MSGLNKVLLMGNLGNDPELKIITGGQPVLNLRLATTESYLDKNNVRQERTDWHSIVLWGKRAEALSKILTKGQQIFVEGRIQTRSYEKNGEKRFVTDIVASNVVLGARKSQENGQTTSHTTRAPAATPAAGAPARGWSNDESDPGPSAEDEIPF